jgi:predicted transcriptional regulator
MVGNTQDQGGKYKKRIVSNILSYITDNPGQHYNNMLRALKIAPGTLQYHLNRMERSHEIIVLRKRYYTRYFPVSMENPVDQKIMVLLRQNIPRKLLIILLEDTEKTGHELVELLNVTKSTLSYYMRHLEKLDVLYINIEGREKRYSLKNPERIAELIKKHKKSFGDEMVDRFVEVWVRI